eukprot:10224244-Alexandrium_andersonii.AAC.1
MGPTPLPASRAGPSKAVPSRMMFQYIAAQMNSEALEGLSSAGIVLDLRTECGVPVQGLRAHADAQPVCIEYADDG